MAWVVDTAAVLDLITADPVHEAASTACLHSHLVDGMVMIPQSLTGCGIGISLPGGRACLEKGQWRMCL